ncbi:hypothetical protein [Helicobacter mustelae]|uniref:hypothetical protein n=1 Tax=Helicobacter mustelae TaxID=217 RepID=UPI0002F2534B|nr:hypothetical protein [Helicobacter mustelae]
MLYARKNRNRAPLSIRHKVSQFLQSFALLDSNSAAFQFKRFEQNPRTDFLTPSNQSLWLIDSFLRTQKTPT